MRQADLFVVCGNKTERTSVLEQFLLCVGLEKSHSLIVRGRKGLLQCLVLSVDSPETQQLFLCRPDMLWQLNYASGMRLMDRPQAHCAPWSHSGDTGPLLSLQQALAGSAPNGFCSLEVVLPLIAGWQIKDETRVILCVMRSEGSRKGPLHPR